MQDASMISSLSSTLPMDMFKSWAVVGEILNELQSLLFIAAISCKGKKVPLALEFFAKMRADPRVNRIVVEE